MEIDLIKGGIIRFKEVYDRIVFETETGDKLVVCMRGNGFEIAVNQIDTRGIETFNWYTVEYGMLTPILDKNEEKI